MDEQPKSFDRLLELNQDFGIPEQLFEDSDAGMEDIYSTVEIETTDADTSNTKVHGTSTNQSNLANKEGLASQITIPKVNPMVTQSNVPSVVNTTAPLAAPSNHAPLPVPSNHAPLPVPSNHAPLKMVSVPINSDVITQGNSQVVLIPVGGMDSAKLENSIKVPEGQKLVIIQPQEILKTIEQKKSQKFAAQNLTVAQQGIMLQGVGASQLMPQVTLVASQPTNRELVKLTVPSTIVPQSVSIPQNVQHFTFPSVKPQPVQTLQTSMVNVQVPCPAMVQVQTKANPVPNSSGNTGKTNTSQPGIAMKLQPHTMLQKVVVGGIPQTQMVQPKLSTTGLTTSQTGLITPETGLTTSQAGLTTPQTGLTTPQTGSVTTQTGSATTQTGSVTTQTGSATTQTGSATTQTGSATTQTGSATTQTGVTTSQTSVLPGLPSQDMQTGSTPNAYQTLKQKLKEENSTENSSNTENGNNTEAGNAKSLNDMHSNAETNENEKVQNNVPVNEFPAEKVVVTYVPSDKPAQIVTKRLVTTDNFTGAYILGPKKSEAREQQPANRQEPVTTDNLTGAYILGPKKSDGPEHSTANGQQPANRQEPVSEQQQASPQIVPRILLPVSRKKSDEIKVEGVSMRPVPNSSDTPSTSMETDPPSPEKNLKKRGRPRKDQSKSSVSEENTKHEAMKSFPGPIVKIEPDRQGHSPGKAKTPKINEHQMKAVKHRRVSNTNPWTCTLCGKVSFATSLGCLYGPYAGDGDVGNGGRGVGHREEGEPQAKKRRDSNEDGEELWFHRDCIVWSPGVYSLGESLAGYNQVVADAQSRKCNYCSNTGATLVCLHRACKKQFHFFCAKKTGCVFDESNYTIQCRKHEK